jgi:hypothetical protein
MANLFAGGAQPFAVRLLGALHPTAVGHEILYARKARDILDLRQNDQRENLANPRHGWEPRKRLHVLRFGTPGNKQCHLAEQLVIVINEGNGDFNGLAHAGLRKMFLDSLAVGFVRQLLADLREIVLTSGSVNVGQEFGAFGHQMTAAPQ